MRRLGWWAFAAFCFFAALSGACNRTPERTIVVYTSVDEIFARPIVEDFERRTGTKVILVPDTEETKSTGIVNRLIAEKARPKADVFWSGDPMRAEVLDVEGVAARFRPNAAKDLPHEYSDDDDHWTGFSARARVIVWNKNLCPENERPTSIRDFAAPRFKNRAAIANPLFGTTAMHAAALYLALGDAEAQRLFDAMLANGVKILASNGDVKSRVAAGDFAIGLTDTDDAYGALLDHRPIGVVFPDQEDGGLGTPIIPNAAVLIAGGPNGDLARTFIEDLVGKEAEAALARSEAAQFPLRPGVEGPAAFPPFTKLRAMRCDYSRLAQKTVELARGPMRAFVDRGR